ncbi:TPR repeat protein [Actinokineospora baliensis]|uniref:tetratricopeptide repeat protein n=1 Tax=Actinokineospora baliensis TaxID=547056 RepID=UPI00195698F5|nr:sel1 repeat family protein [Actinokineospora baliensis]MBM7774988.1 TPR repeat protein [Actinokineospora baliensis]
MMAEDQLAEALRLADTLTGYEDESAIEQLVETLLRAAAKQGHVRAMAELGAFLWHVRGDEDDARPWLVRAAEAGEGDSMNLLGDIHDFLGDGDEALRWYEAGAAAGDPHAVDNLAALRTLGH